MHILMIFLDGVGLGDDDPATNPFAAAHMPTLMALTNGKRWLRGIGRQRSERAVFIPTDPRLGVPGKPQSASGQAAILTGLNVPQLIGEHYGPRPNAAIREIIDRENIFKETVNHGLRAALLEGYPPPFHAAINRGKRLPSSYQQALLSSGQRLFDENDIYKGDALAVDWIGQAWRDGLGYTDSPLYTPYEAGVKLVELSRRYDFAFFSHWFTDHIGHREGIDKGVAVLELFDGVMGGALDVWDDDEGLILVTSDHGNMEDLTHTKHTENDVPSLIIGSRKDEFAQGFAALTDFVPRIRKLLFNV